MKITTLWLTFFSAIAWAEPATWMSCWAGDPTKPTTLGVEVTQIGLKTFVELHGEDFVQPIVFQGNLSTGKPPVRVTLEFDSSRCKLDGKLMDCDQPAQRPILFHFADGSREGYWGYSSFSLEAGAAPESSLAKFGTMTWDEHSNVILRDTAVQLKGSWCRL